MALKNEREDFLRLGHRPLRMWPPHGMDRSHGGRTELYKKYSGDISIYEGWEGEFAMGLTKDMTKGELHGFVCLACGENWPACKRPKGAKPCPGDKGIGHEDGDPPGER